MVGSERDFLPNFILEVILLLTWDLLRPLLDLGNEVVYKHLTDDTRSMILVLSVLKDGREYPEF